MMHAAMGEFNAKSYDEEVLGDVGIVMWEEDTENEDMVIQKNMFSMFLFS